MITQKQLDIIKNSFKYDEVGNLKKRKQPFRVKFDDKFIITSSGKTVWPGIGAAKSAVINHLRSLSYQYKKDIPYRSAKELREKLEKVGLIQYVPFNDYD